MNSPNNITTSPWLVVCKDGRKDAAVCFHCDWLSNVLQEKIQKTSFKTFRCSEKSRLCNWRKTSPSPPWSTSSERLKNLRMKTWHLNRKIWLSRTRKINYDLTKKSRGKFLHIQKLMIKSITKSFEPRSGCDIVVYSLSIYKM